MHISIDFMTHPPTPWVWSVIVHNVSMSSTEWVQYGSQLSYFCDWQLHGKWHIHLRCKLMHNLPFWRKCGSLTITDLQNENNGIPVPSFTINPQWSTPWSLILTTEAMWLTSQFSLIADNIALVTGMCITLSVSDPHWTDHARGIVGCVIQVISVFISHWWKNPSEIQELPYISCLMLC